MRVWREVTGEKADSFRKNILEKGGTADRIIELLNERDVPTAFILWGSNAKSKMPLITNPKHAVFTAAHPSPLSAYNGFFGCRHFSKVNEFLKSNGIEPIDWSIH